MICSSADCVVTSGLTPGQLPIKECIRPCEYWSLPVLPFRSSSMLPLLTMTLSTWFFFSFLNYNYFLDKVFAGSVPLTYFNTLLNTPHVGGSFSFFRSQHKVTLTEKTSVANQYEVDLPPPKASLLIFMTTLSVCLLSPNYKWWWERSYDTQMLKKYFLYEWSVDTCQMKQNWGINNWDTTFLCGLKIKFNCFC